jgi:hypothetical protein
VIEFLVYIASLLIAVAGSIAFFASLLLKKDFKKTIFFILICIAIANISLNYGIKRVESRSVFQYFQTSTKLLNHFEDLIKTNKYRELEFKICYINEKIENKHWRDKDRFKNTIEYAITNFNELN